MRRNEWTRSPECAPITQNALARLLKPHKVVPADVGPEHARRNGYKGVQFERLFQAYLYAPSSASSSKPRSRAERKGGADA
jgi:hypothetical protein